MKNIKLKRCAIIIICIIFIFSALANTVIAENIHHLEKCTTNNCQTCVIIQNAINFINILLIVVICIKILVKNVPLTKLITNAISNKKVFSLIQIQVQHNE